MRSRSGARAADICSYSSNLRKYRFEYAATVHRLTVSSSDLARAAEIIRAGGVVAYPTEAVFGLGCDPVNEAAVEKLLKLKQRPRDKGLILIAAEFAQLEGFLKPLDNPIMQRVMR